MGVTFYRNYLNREMKRFGKFSKQIAENLSSNLSINVIFSPHKEKCLDQLNKSETIIIITHGSPDEIYHKFDHDSNKHQILLNKHNIHLLKEKKVIAISCATTRSFGEQACTQAGCKVYLGFNNKIHFDKLNKKNASRDYQTFVGNCYKEAFIKVIQESLINNWDFEKLKTVLSLELRQGVLKKAIEIQKQKPSFYVNNGLDQAILAVSNVSNSIVVHGDSTETII